MGLNEVLKGYKPQVLDEEDFEILKGSYKSAITAAKVEENKEWGDRYHLEFTVNEVLEGNGNPGRKFWKRFPKTDEGMQDLLDVLFTAGVDLPRDSVETFEASLPKCLDADVVIRAWGWTPEKDMQGNPIPEDERTARQMFKVLSAKKAAKKATKKAAF